MQDDNSSRGGSPNRFKSKISEQRACDDCRVRKIRCDRKRPCSHCRTAGLVCRTTTERPKEQRSRVTISKQYETKIDRIEDRLASIEQLLRKGSSAYSPHNPTPESRTSSDLHTDRHHYRDDSIIHVSGSTGAHAGSLAAKDVLEHTLSGNASLSQDPQLSAALASLQGIVQTIKSIPRRNVDVTASTTIVHPQVSSDEQLPTWEAVRSMLEGLKDNPPDTFSYYMPFRSFQELYQACHDFYTTDKPVLQSKRLVVYMGLYCIYADLGLQKKPDDAQKYNDIALAFQYELLKAIHGLPLILPATMENVEALMCGAFVAIDVCRPSLCWTLSSAAIRLCQTMGYNRISTMSNDSNSVQNKKSVLFWMAYCMDRNTGLRLGRSPAIQDSDITVPKLGQSDYLPIEAIQEFNTWIDFARVQGQINDELYGPVGLARSPDERSRLAETYAAELHQIYRDREHTVDTQLLDLGPAMEPILASVSIQYYSTLTLALHAAAKPYEVSQPTLAAARSCLHQCRDLSRRNSKDLYAWSMWCHWVLLQTPLTPLTVIFSYIIANYNTASEDLQLLQDYVAVLEYGRSVSEGVEKYYRMCSVLAEVAAAYVNARAKEAATRQLLSESSSNQPVNHYFDARLSQMGFAALQPPMVGDPAAAMPPWPQGDNTDYLSDWFSTNTLLHGILEQDLNNFGPLDFDIGQNI